MLLIEIRSYYKNVLMSFLGLFDTDKVKAFFSLMQTPSKNSFSGILSICSLWGTCWGVFLVENRRFCGRMLVMCVFCGKSFFRLFLLFSQSVKKNWKTAQKLFVFGKIAVYLWRFLKTVWTLFNLSDNWEKINSLYNFFLINNFLYYYHERWENYGRPGG